MCVSLSLVASLPGWPCCCSLVVCGDAAGGSVAASVAARALGLQVKKRVGVLGTIHLR